MSDPIWWFLVGILILLGLFWLIRPKNEARALNFVLILGVIEVTLTFIALLALAIWLITRGLLR